MMSCPNEQLSCELRTPPLDAGAALAAVEVRGAFDQLAARLHLEPLEVGGVRLSSLCGVDTGLVMRPTHDSLILTPHGGPLLVRSLLGELAARGIPCRATRSYAEARSSIEQRMLEALARAQSPAAVDLLLCQPRLWGGNESQRTDANRDRVLRRLIEPPLVVVVGRANIGKSSLANALARSRVSVVCDEPGTTRDHVGVLLELDGLAVQWIDMPGLRAQADEIERAAWKQAEGFLSRAALILNCGDVEQAPLDLPGIAQEVILTLQLRADLGPVAWRWDCSVAAERQAGLSVLAREVRERLVPRALMNHEHPWRFWED